MTINATLINLYHVCHRELWLHSREIRMEQSSDLVYQGKLIGENTYTQRSDKYSEIEIAGSKIDFYDAKNKIIHEVKKSDKLEHAHIAQVKYYIWLLEQEGITGVTGILEYPKLRKKETILLDDEDRNAIPVWIEIIKEITTSDLCPDVINKPYCKTCSYYEFCYAQE
jgi:CRISPR-associated exonuclease Cas4